MPDRDWNILAFPKFTDDQMASLARCPLTRFVRFRDGERVRRGQVLVQLDDAQARADVAAAQATLTESESIYNRSRELLSTDALSKSQFDQLEATLKARGKDEEFRKLRAISDMANIISVRQKEPLGLGHAVLCARNLVGDEPFGVMLGDDMIDAEDPGIRQLARIYRQYNQGVVALMEYLNKTVRRPVQLNRALHIEPLAVIPIIRTKRDRQRQRIVAGMALAAGIVVAVVLALVVVHYTTGSINGLGIGVAKI